MPVTATRPLTSLAGGLLVLVALTGCGVKSQQQPVKNYTGEPTGVEAPASSAGGASWAAWLDDGRQIGIVLYGSSTCPPTVASISVIADNQLKATFSPAPGGVCTRDYVPHTTVFTTPESVTTTSDVSILLPDGTLTVPGLQG